MCLHYQTLHKPLTIATTDELNDIITSVNIQRSTIGLEREVRRKTRRLNSEKLHSQLNVKIPVTLIQHNERPTGPSAKLFVNDISLIVRNFAPMNVEKWNDIEPACVTKMIERITSKFDINMSLPWVKRYVNKMCMAAFCKFRYRLKKYFEKYSTVDEARENKPEAVKTQAEWDFLCIRFSREELQINTQNADKKLHLTYHHNAWSKYFISHEDEIVRSEELKEHAKIFEELKEDAKRMQELIAKFPA
ncbi:uncharacterized protein LOC121052676 [Rosa chinensis]|uniref:uncharacterized protein LOC121052676 n=1 Tax=Rosa chinensis TaxID=74649 RepID=UPI001AD8F9CE|nr:uncharacterized protein LOC121052676 [Rosa chinensis]